MGEQTDSTLFRYSSGHFFGTRTISNFSRYSPGFYNFWVLTQIVPSSDTRPDSFSVLTRILNFPGTRPHSTIFGYSHRLHPLLIFVWTLFRYSHGFYLFPVLALILPFLGSHTDCTLFRYSSGQFFDTRTDSTFSRYSPGFYNFWLRTKIVPSSDTRRDTFSVLARILPFPGNLPDSTIFG